MKKMLLAFAVILTFFVVPAVEAYTITWNVAQVGDSKIYSYFFTSSDTDTILSFHIFAPVNPTLITSASSPDGWIFEVSEDEETGGADICWYTEDPEIYGLLYGQSFHLSFAAPSYLTTVYDYIPGDFYLGNWGYETDTFPGMVWMLYPSVPVPQGSLSYVPEPASMTAILTGIAAFSFRRLRRTD